MNRKSLNNLALVLSIFLFGKVADAQPAYFQVFRTD